jgi:hypothetical protein
LIEILFRKQKSILIYNTGYDRLRTDGIAGKTKQAVAATLSCEPISKSARRFCHTQRRGKGLPRKNGHNISIRDEHRPVNIGRLQRPFVDSFTSW